MTLRRRIAHLESRPGARPDTIARDAAAFLDRLDALSARAKAGGDFAGTPGASPAERYCRALACGDTKTAEAIMMQATQAFALAALTRKHGAKNDTGTAAGET